MVSEFFIFPLSKCYNYDKPLWKVTSIYLEVLQFNHKYKQVWWLFFRDVERKDVTNVLEMHIFITQFFHKFDLRWVMSWPLIGPYWQYSLLIGQDHDALHLREPLPTSVPEINVHWTEGHKPFRQTRHALLPQGEGDASKMLFHENIFVYSLSLFKRSTVTWVRWGCSPVDPAWWPRVSQTEWRLLTGLYSF